MNRNFQSSKVAVMLIVASLLAGCNNDETSNNQPISIQSCGETLSFEQAPQKVVMFSETNASILHSLDVLDKVAFRAGNGSADALFTNDLKEAVSKIPMLEGKSNATGGVVISTEAIIATGADLVLGYETTVDKKALKKAGIQLYTPDAYCPNASLKKAEWSLVDKEIDKMALLFDQRQKGDELKAQLQEKLAKLSTDNTAQTAVALYIGGSGESVYAYGASSMIQPIFEANGIKNVYSENPDRVFDITVEDLLGKNPQWVVILVSDYPKAQARGANKRLLDVQGAAGLQALQNNRVIFMPFNLIDPPSNLSVKGAQTLPVLMKQK